MNSWKLSKRIRSSFSGSSKAQDKKDSSNNKKKMVIMKIFWKNEVTYYEAIYISIVKIV